MAQDTRKDPRAKVLTMTVRYKSATLDEFIEHHSYDVSRGGMFIKTPSPFPPGTLLKFEVKIADDQKLIQGVGRVVWKRETADSTPEKPAGMGVKFIKVDEESKRVIGQLVANRGDESSSAFDAGSASKPPAAGGSKAPAAKTAAPRPSPSKAPAAGGASKGAQAGSSVKPQAAARQPDIRKATMIGLGAIGAKSAGTAPRAETGEKTPTPAPAEASRGDASFFPKTDSEADMPPAEDRTVMKQAAELLEDALREAGGSMDEIDDKEPPAEAKKAEEKKPVAAAEPAKKPDEEKSTDEDQPKRSAAEARPSSSRSRESEKSGEESRPSPSSRALAAGRPSSRAPASLEGTASESSGGKGVWLVVAALLVGGGVYALTKKSSAPPPLPEPVATEEPATTEEPEKAAAEEWRGARRCR
jgi:uncharacterized protein (TIGR02266 family)